MLSVMIDQQSPKREGIQCVQKYCCGCNDNCGRLLVKITGIPNITQ